VRVALVGQLVTPLLVVVQMDQTQYFQLSHQLVVVELLVIQVALLMLLVLVDQVEEDQGMVIQLQEEQVIHLQ
jgi:hypothetical protein